MKRLLQTSGDTFTALLSQSGRRTLRGVLAFLHMCFAVPFFLNPAMYEQYPAFYRNFQVLPPLAWAAVAAIVGLSLMFSKRPWLAFSSQFMSAALFYAVAQAATSEGINSGTAIYGGLALLSLMSTFMLSADLKRREDASEGGGGAG